MKLQIAGQPWTVEQFDSEILRGFSCVGVTMTSNRILISNDLSEAERRETVIHELMHAVWLEMNIGFSDKTEEIIVTKLAQGLSSIVDENPPKTLQGLFF
tara:strand:- start:130 stop:429 length:300 start_codon:yes stop_codon:yes gene_type:complete